MTSWARRYAMVAALVLVLAGLTAVTASAAAGLPAVLPALQQWSAGGAQGFGWTGSGRIVVNTADAAALTTDARTFANDLGLATNRPVPQVVTGVAADARAGDVFVALGSTDTQLGAEGYAVTVGPVLQLSARTANGAFWGTRTVLQWLHQQTTLPAGTARDWPQYRIRAALVDGQPFPMGWWFNEIRELSYLKINQMRFPANVAGMTEAQERQLDAFARTYHVELTPLIDMPAYLSVDETPIPDAYTLRGDNGRKYEGALDLTNPQAVAWARGLITSYIGRFAGSTWHTGGDEWPAPDQHVDDPTNLQHVRTYAVNKYGSGATAADLYRDFINGNNAIVRQKSKTMHVWNDDFYPASKIGIDSNMVVEHWVNYLGNLTPTELANNGNQLVNANQDYMYYNEGNPDLPNTTAARIWENFNPAVFNGGLRLPGGAADPHLAGIELAQWHTYGAEPGQLERDLQPLNRALAQRGWGSPKLFPTWNDMVATVAAVGRAPGVVETPAPGDAGEGAVSGSRAAVFGDSQNVFTVRADGALAHSWWEPGSDPQIETLPAVGVRVVGQPVAFVTDHQQHVYARGQNNHLYTWETNEVSGGWATADLTTAAAPNLDIVGDPTGFAYGEDQHVFARGSDGHLHHWFYVSASDSQHADDWGGQLTGTPAAYLWGSSMNVVGRGPDGALWRWWWQASDPSYLHLASWGGQLAADATPTAYGFAEGAQEVFARDPAGNLLNWSYDQKVGQLAVQDLTAATGLRPAGNPVGYQYGAEKHVFFRDAGNGHLDHIWLRPTLGHDDWTAASSGNVVGDMTGMNYHNAEQHVFSAEGQHWWWTQADDVVRHDVWPG